MADLLPLLDLPDGFRDLAPSSSASLQLGLTSLEPWWVLEGETLRVRYLGLKDREPDVEPGPVRAATGQRRRGLLGRFVRSGQCDSTTSPMPASSSGRKYPDF